MLMVFRNKFSNRSQLHAWLTQGKYNLSLFFDWLSLQINFAVSTDISQYQVNDVLFTSHSL